MLPPSGGPGGTNRAPLRATKAPLQGGRGSTVMINYSLSQKRNPQDPDGARKWYPSAQYSRVVGVDQIAAEIVEASALTEGDVLSAIRQFENRIIAHLEQGEKVKLEKLGSFHLTISSEGADTEEAYDASLIRKVNVRYTPRRPHRGGHPPGQPPVRQSAPPRRRGSHRRRRRALRRRVNRRAHPHPPGVRTSTPGVRTSKPGRAHPQAWTCAPPSPDVRTPTPSFRAQREIPNKRMRFLPSVEMTGQAKRWDLAYAQLRVSLRSK